MLDSAYGAFIQKKVEGENNNYRIYRKPVITFDEIKKNSKLLTDTFSSKWMEYLFHKTCGTGR